MRIEITEAVWTTAESHELSLGEICEHTGLTEAEVRELVASELLAPRDCAATAWSFGPECLAIARTAYRLRTDLELEPHGLAIVLGLLSRVRALEEELRAARARSPRG
jgi:chaperone modulatory protein CbpM